MGILKLKPVGKDYLWGGNRLNTEYNKNILLSPLAETWECSVHPDGQSVIAEGEYMGRTLAEILRTHPEYIGRNAKEFPILVKLIDAKKDLSVQVHPDDEYAMEYEHENGKTEMWYVLDAETGAHLIYGFEHPVTEDILRGAVKDGTLGKHLHKQYVKKGDVIFVPAGTVHGLGAGIVVAEIQESSNVTYRVYDYDRVDKYGQKRQLHFDKAIQVMDMHPVRTGIRLPRMVQYVPGCARETLCKSKYFEIERLRIQSRADFMVYNDSCQIILCVDGRGTLCDGMESRSDLKKGDCAFLIAGSGTCKIIGTTEVLRIQLPCNM